MKRLLSSLKAVVSIVLAATFVVSVAACSGSNNDSNTNTGTNTVENRVISVIADGKSSYELVRPSDASKSVIKDCNFLRAKLSSIAGCSFDLGNDSTEAAEYEILVGLTNRQLSQDTYASLQVDQFAFSVNDNSVAIVASNDACLTIAIDKFVEYFVKEDGITLNSSEFPMYFQCGDDYETVEVDNTANIPGDDPYVVNHNGSYYYCWSGDGGVRVAQIDNLNDIKKDGGTTVFNGRGYSAIWAPELIYVRGEWYIYVAMCEGPEGDNAKHRMYCLKGTSQDPTDKFQMVGQVTDRTNRWAIDGTVFEYKGELYTVWSGWEGTVNVAQNLYIAHMSDPCTIDSNRVMISKPDSWDAVISNPTVNEGPCALVVGDTVFILYSGNGSWDDNYSIGYLVCTDGDLLNADSWTKSRSAILSKASQCYGPGHCSVTTADDGSYWIIYHANLVSGTGWSGRSVRIQELKVSETSISRMAPKLTVSLPISEKYFIGPIEN